MQGPSAGFRGWATPGAKRSDRRTARACRDAGQPPLLSPGLRCWISRERPRALLRRMRSGLKPLPSSVIVSNDASTGVAEVASESDEGPVVAAVEAHDHCVGGVG
jgi:hypothetical protein